MHKKLFLIFAFVFFLNFPQSLFASVVINEIMYNSPTGYTDWIELFNNGEDITLKTSSDLSPWKISTTDNDNPAKFNFNGSNYLFKTNTYIIIACDKEKFLSFYKSENQKDFMGTVIDITASGFNNENGYIRIWDQDEIIASLQYNSNYNNSSYIFTPGTVNNNDTNENTDNNTKEEIQNTTTATSGGSSLSSSSQTVIKKNPELKILAKNFGFVGMPIDFESIILNEEYRNIYGKYFWNFGDGETKELTSLENIPFTHTYLYAGEYNVYLEYYRTNYELKPYLTSQISLNIVEPTLVISRTGEEGDFFIELHNKSNMNLDLTNFTLKGLNKTFIFPRNTLLNKEKKIVLSPKVTNFNFGDKNFLEILDPSGKVIYSQKVIGEVKGISTKKISSSNKNFIPASNENTSQDFDENLDIASEENTKDLVPYKEEDENNWNIIFIFVLVILGTVALVYFVRKSSIKKGDEEEFEILDE